MTTILTLATEAADHLKTSTRDDGTTYIHFDDTAPEWTKDLAYAAHDSGAYFPALAAAGGSDDYRYRFLEYALYAIIDNDGDEETARDQMTEPDVYTSGLTRWLDSDNQRVDYLTQALEEFGSDMDGFRLLALAQYLERGEVFDQVWTFLESMAEDDTEE